MFKRKRILNFIWISTCITCIALTAACGEEQSASQPGSESPGQRLEPSNERGNAVIPIVERDGKGYVSSEKLLSLLEFNTLNEGKQLAFGDTDIVYQLKAGSTNVSIGDQQIKLPDAPLWHNNQVWLPKTAIKPLFADTIRYEVKNSHLVLDSRADALRPYHENEKVRNSPKLQQNDSLSFAENRYLAQSNGNGNGNGNVNVDKMIAEARDYLGVEYEFGAEPYRESEAFDCSSYVRYIYGKFGVELPRVSRNQAKEGERVSRKNLNRGDLLFFYVPGRFRTDEKVGHVGMYIGNGKMIHSSPAPKDGVQITNINKNYWERTFLKAKRVL